MTDYDSPWNHAQTPPAGGRLPSAPVQVPAAPRPTPAVPQRPAAPVPTPPAASPVAPAAPVAAVTPPVAPAAGGPVAAPAASTPGVVQKGDTDTAGQSVDLDRLLKGMVAVGGSDLHLSAGSPPLIRLHGDLQAVDGYGPLPPRAIEDAIYAVLTDRQRRDFEENWELDFAYVVPGHARFRGNVMRQRKSVGVVMRTIPWEIKNLEELGMPEVVGSFAHLPRGLVLVTGPTGSGKSTTLAAVVDRANRTRRGHILTIEEPIEFEHRPIGCVVNQREVGEDTKSFEAALKHGLRQDPDIILVGELRDLETISVALHAVETGHLVLATLHTQSAQDSVTRIVDVFPANQQQQIRTQLAAALQGIVTQTLCKTTDGKGRVAAVEVLVATPAVRAMIREDKLQQMQSAMQAGGQFGMQTLNQHLADLAKAGSITYDEAEDKCSDKEDLKTLTGGREQVALGLRRAQAQRNGLGMGGLGSL